MDQKLITMEKTLFVTVLWLENYTPYYNDCYLCKLSFTTEPLSDVAVSLYATIKEEVRDIDDKHYCYHIFVSGTVSAEELSEISSSLKEKDVHDNWWIQQY